MEHLFKAAYQFLSDLIQKIGNIKFDRDLFGLCKLGNIIADCILAIT